MKHKITFGLILVCFFFTSCNVYDNLGTVTVLSSKQIDFNKKYCLKQSFAGSSNKELKKNASPTNNINEALDNLIKSVPGGIFVMNARILYGLHGVTVTGDVYGLCDEEDKKENAQTQNSFSVGDDVMFKKGESFIKAEIEAIKNDNECIIRSQSGAYFPAKFSDLIKIQD